MTASSRLLAAADVLDQWGTGPDLATAALLRAVVAQDWCCDDCGYDPLIVRPTHTAALAVADAVLGKEQR